MNKTNKQYLGIKAENIATQLLMNKDYTLLKRNFLCKYGEIDIILKKDNIIIFVEVRCRSINNLYTAAESISCAKKNKIKKTASFYLSQQQHLYLHSCRFDVITVTHDNACNFKTSWLIDAFY